MTPAARAQAAIEIVDAWRAGGQGLDRVLTGWGRAHRFAGSKDRAAIADLVYDAVRRMRSAAWVAGADNPDGRALIRGSLTLDGTDPATLFTGERHAPAALEHHEIGTRPLKDAARAVRLDLPDWIDQALAAIPAEALAPLRHRAAVDLRVNAVKATQAQALAALAEDGIAVEPGPLNPNALRVTDGARKVQRSRAYEIGLVEIQDAASQAVAAMAGAQPGETVLDLCAGGGGKTLALAAAMQNQGRLIAHDIAPKRIAGLPERAARAGATVEVAPPGMLDALHGQCDLVFVDAPCSGSGAWRRNPDAKWRFAQTDLARLRDVQATLLVQASKLTVPKGRILYATCSILDQENTDQVDGFLTAHPDWHLQTAKHFALSDGADGFFGAMLTRS